MQAVITKDYVLCVGSSDSVTVGYSSLPKGKRAVLLVLWRKHAELNHPLDMLLLNRTPVKQRASAAGLLISVSALSPWLSPGLQEETEAQQQAQPPWQVRRDLLLVSGLACVDLGGGGSSRE